MPHRPPPAKVPFASGSVPSRLVRLEAVGFGTLILLVWLNELLDIPQHVFGDAPSPTRFSEATVESAVILLLCLGVIMVTRRLMARLAYLESYVVLCAWCRRVRSAEGWVSFEAFLGAHQADTSHGMCPECEAKFE